MFENSRKIADFIYKRYHEDQFLFEQCNSDINIIDFKIEKFSIEVNYSFWSDQTKIGIEDASLFDYHVEDSYGFHIPKYLILNHFNDKYKWLRQDDFDKLDLDSCDVTSDYLGGDIVEWDDERIDEPLVEFFMKDNLGVLKYVKEMLLNEYFKGGALPEYVPERVRPYLMEIINQDE